MAMESLNYPLTAQEFRCQFHQHFMRGFFVQKFCAQLFCNCILGLNFFWYKNIGANVGEIDHWFIYKYCIRF
jgi:hypothetical protein